MTSEERFTRIENALQAVAENQAGHDVRLARIEALVEKNAAQIEKTAAAVAKNAEQIDKNADGIRQLILLNGSYVKWQQEADARLNRALDRLDQRFDRLEKLLEQWFRQGGRNGHES
jgi:hypothetical protein